MMQAEAFSFFKKHVAHTVLNLERLLSTIKPFQLEYLIKLKEIFELGIVDFKNNHDYKLWKKILLMSQYLSGMSVDANTAFRDLPTTLTLAQLVEHLSRTVNDQLKLILNSDELEIDQSLCDRMDEIIPNLVMSYNHLDSQHQAIFKEMLQADLSAADSEKYRYFIHDQQQVSELGKNIAGHNHQLRQQLVQANINTDLAFNYAKTTTFVYSLVNNIRNHEK